MAVRNSKSSDLITELEPALEFVCSSEHGSLDQLKTKLSQRRIDLLAAAGFIAYGATRQNPTWRATKIAMETNNKLNGTRKLTKNDKLKNFICKHFLHI